VRRLGSLILCLLLSITAQKVVFAEDAPGPSRGGSGAGGSLRVASSAIDGSAETTALIIDAPAGPVPIGRFVVLPIRGAEDTPQVLLAPKGADALIDISVGQPSLVFRAAEPGSYEVVVVASRARVIPDDCYARCLILVGEQPDPPPPPPPPPPPEPGALKVLLLYEQSPAETNMTDRQRDVLASNRRGG
jgi:hypothetical protein